jgi:uncharacterized protein (DUF2141 family)
VIAWWSVVATGSELSMRVVDLPTDAGVVECSLYRDEGQWLDTERAYRKVDAAPRGGAAVCAFGDVPPGRYAVAVHHDVNENGHMDFRLGVWPLEPWGVSRDAPVFVQRPRFVDAAFAHPGAPGLLHAR